MAQTWDEAIVGQKWSYDGQGWRRVIEIQQDLVDMEVGAVPPGLDLDGPGEDQPVGHGSPDFLALLDEMRALHLRKNNDYGREEDPFLNVRQSENWGVRPWVGAMIRLNDKIVRLQAAASGSTLANEGVEDSLMDIAAYALIALVLYRQDG